jgi:hypothetical protein
MCVPEEIVENFDLIKAIFEETDTSNRWQPVPAKVPKGRLITSWHPVCPLQRLASNRSGAMSVLVSSYYRFSATASD